MTGTAESVDHNFRRLRCVERRAEYAGGVVVSHLVRDVAVKLRVQVKTRVDLIRIARKQIQIVEGTFIAEAAHCFVAHHLFISFEPPARKYHFSIQFPISVC